MNKFFYPAVHLMNNLKYPQKFLLISLIFLSIILGMEFFILSDLKQEIELSKQELEGLNNVKPQAELMLTIQQHRTAIYGYLNGKKDNKDEILTLQRKIDSIFEEFYSINDGDSFDLNKYWQELKSDWQIVKSKSLKGSATEALNKHTELIDKIISLIGYTDRTYKIILDPDIGTSVIIPRQLTLLENLSLLLTHITVVYARRNITGEEKHDLAVLSGIINKDSKEITTNLLDNFDEFTEQHKKLSRNVREYNSNLKQLLSELEILKKADNGSFNADNLILAGNQAQNTLETLFFASLDSLKEVINDRIEKLNLYRMLLLSLFFLSLLLPAYLFSGFYFSVINSISQMKNVLEEVSKGNFSTKADIKTRDEFNNLADSLNIMTEKLHSLFTRENFLKQIIQTPIISKNYREALQKIVILTGQQYNADRCFLVEYDREIEDFLPVKEETTYVSSANIKNIKGLRIDKQSYLISGQVYGGDKILVVENIEEADFISEKVRQITKEFDVKSFIAVPIIYKSALTGLLFIDYVKEQKTFSPEEIELLLLVAAQTAIIIQKKSIEETKSTFIATLTHDLRSPTIAQQKALEVIISGKLGKSLEDFSEYLKDVYRINEEELRIINNILTVHHLESGVFKLNPILSSISALINDSVRTMMLLAKEQEINIVQEIQPDLPEIVIDKDEISRVVINLIGNALKYTSMGTRVAVKAYRHDNNVEVAISDNGPGIPEEDKPKIFQRFPTEKRKIGTGLGLYLSKQLVEAHGGRIWFESEVGKGTTFYFSLPISQNT